MMLLLLLVLLFGLSLWAGASLALEHYKTKAARDGHDTSSYNCVYWTGEHRSGWMAKCPACNAP